MFRINRYSHKVDYFLFKKPSQALFAKLFVDGKGNVLLGWLDEDKMPYRIVWVYSKNYMNTYTSPNIISDKKHGIVLFEPIILNGQPYMVYTLGRKLLIRNLLNYKVIEIDELKKPIVLKAKVKKNDLWLFVQEGDELVKVYKLSKELQKKKVFLIDKVEIKKKLHNLNKFLWSLYDCAIVKDKPVCVITAKFKYLPGVKVNGFTLPDRFNVFVSSDGKFKYIHRTKPFLITFTFPSVVTDGDSWIVSYFGRKFIYGNVFVSYKGIPEKSDVSLEPPYAETGIPYVISIRKGIYRFLYPIRHQNKVYLKLVDVDIEKLEEYYKLPSKIELEKALKDRIKQFVKCQIEDNIKCIEEFIDPVSRAIYSKKPKVKLDILDYKYNKIFLLDNAPLAVGIGTIKYLIPKGTFPGINKDIVREIETQDVWAYINGKWYYVPPAPIVKYYLKW